MILKKISYKEFTSSPREWILDDFELEKVNLLVGANACGKSRTLNVIHGLAKIIMSSQISYNNGKYVASFLDEREVSFDYTIEYDDNVIIEEKLIRAGEELFHRASNGQGEIFSENQNSKIQFKIPTNELVISRRDEIQYPYLETLHNWAQNTRHFRFSKEEEKNTLGLIGINNAPTIPFNQKITNQAIEIFRIGKGSFREKFVDQIIADFNEIGYSISNIDVGTLNSIKIDGGAGKVVGLRVKETDRDTSTDQNEMSDGMFRALSLIIHYNYFILEESGLNVLVDDIGEGLDYERSTKLIQLLIRKTNESGVQLIMSTNDIFVMNNTDLKFWQIIYRDAKHVKVKNQKNSGEMFSDFKFSGLTNFDFFTTNFKS